MATDTCLPFKCTRMVKVVTEMLFPMVSFSLNFFRTPQKIMMPGNRTSQEEQNGANFSSAAPSSEEQKGHKE